MRIPILVIAFLFIAVQANAAVSTFYTRFNNPNDTNITGYRFYENGIEKCEASASDIDPSGQYLEMQCSSAFTPGTYVGTVTVLYNDGREGNHSNEIQYIVMAPPPPPLPDVPVVDQIEIEIQYDDGNPTQVFDQSPS